MTRPAIVVLLLLLPAVAAANAVYFGSELGRFAARVPRLASTADLELLKRVVARQMYAALAQIVLLAAPIAIFFGGVVAGLLAPSDVVLVVVPSAVILLVAFAYKQVEARVKTTPADDPELARQRDEIVAVWLKKPLPDW